MHAPDSGSYGRILRLPVTSSLKLNNDVVPARSAAPIALFVYNRPEHTRRTIEYLQKNELAENSELFVFSDAAKSEVAQEAVRKTRSFIKTIRGFRSVDIIERQHNYGLAKSVLSGVSELCNEFGRIIALEDDLITAPGFLTFMNAALERYACEPRVFSVSGFNFAVECPEDYPYDVFFSYRCSSWGWGTWKSRWEMADWGMADYVSFSQTEESQRLFNRGGKDLTAMLHWQMAGELDSWAIRWAYAHWKHDALAALARRSCVFNIGLDGSGVHCRPGAAKQSELGEGISVDFSFPATVMPDPRLTGQIYRMHCPSVPRRCARFVLRKIRNRRKRKILAAAR